MVADSTKRRLTLKNILYHPLTWVAVGVHIVLLIIPFNPEPPEATKDTSDQSEEIESIPVDILNLSEIATSEPPPAPLASPPPSAPAPASATLPQPAPLPADPALADSALADPAPADPGPRPEAQLGPTADLAPVQPLQQSPAYDPSEDQRQFIQNLDGLGLGGYEVNGERSLPVANNFRKKC